MNEGIVALTQVGCNRFLNNLNDFPLRSLARRCVSVLSVGMKSIMLYRGSLNIKKIIEICCIVKKITEILYIVQLYSKLF